uniref:Uncharacterized protein n=1 Tax=Spumella elongata TaxID=89044 RepID=A0A7S3M5G5_9STRA|mmetsp:Transcript_32762/g.107867  ORF Transcript_32762/g.107867 Transcript_32762/m.107867 type:complete len:101 (-) Transcript_32762:120-422(-)
MLELADGGKAVVVQRTDVEGAYHKLSTQQLPDKGGDEDRFNAARERYDQIKATDLSKFDTLVLVCGGPRRSPRCPTAAASSSRSRAGTTRAPSESTTARS